MTDTITNSLEYDGLIAGDFPVARDTVTVKLGQDLVRGAVVGAEDGTSATDTAGNDGPYNFAAGDTLVVNIDAGGNETVTFAAAAGSITDTTVYTGGSAASITDNFTHGADQVGLTMTVTTVDAVNGSVVTVVTVAAACTTAVALAAELAAQVPHVSVSVAAGHVVVTTDEVGLGTTIAIVAGTSAVTWAAAVAGASGLADQDGLTSVITIDGGTAQTITFSGLTTQPEQVAAQINDALIGGSAVVTTGQVVVTSDSQGTGSSVAAAAGTGALTWGSAVAGTGDVVDINAVTVAEFKTVFEADTTGATVTAVGSAFRIDSDSVGTSSTLTFVSGNVLAIVDITAATYTGTGGTGYSIACDKDGDDGSEDPQAVLAADCDATSAATECPVYRTGTFAADKLSFASGTVAADMEEKMAAKGMFQKTTV